MLYPLTFHPILKERVWGGRDLATRYGKPLAPGLAIGESWEITDRPEGVSVIANGPLAGRDLRWLMEQHATELLGASTALAGRFPLLVKILDAREVLSVQVHPPAAVAATLRGEPKTEMWYVTHALAGAEILAGLRSGVTRTEFQQRLTNGTVGECVHRLPVRAGDAMFLPSGRVHALGTGLVIFEVQQNSDTTYRVFDWNRRGADGQLRELHVAPAMASIDFTDFEPGLIPARQEPVPAAGRRPLVADSLFKVEEAWLPAGGHRVLASAGRPIILGVVAGGGCLTDKASGVAVDLRPGQFCLVPAAAGEVQVTATSALTWLQAEPGSGQAAA